MRNKSRSTPLISLVLFTLTTTLLASGCQTVESSSDGTVPDKTEVRATPSDRAVVFRSSPRIFNGRNGAAMSFDRLVSVFDEADVVLIGELHGHPLGLMFAADLWDEGVRRAPDAALSLEFLERDEQASIDDYLTGVIADRAEFVEQSGRERDLPDAHWRMIETAREFERPVVASNAPRRYVKLARIEGYERLRGLTPAQRRLFAIPDALPEGPYRESFATAMGHASDSPAPGMSIDDFFRAQFMWDATMTESIAHSRAAGARPVTHVVGQFHVINGHGIAGLLAEHPDDLLVWTIAVVDEWSDELRDEDHGIADAVVYVGPADSSGSSAGR